MVIRGTTLQNPPPPLPPNQKGGTTKGAPQGQSKKGIDGGRR